VKKELFGDLDGVEGGAFAEVVPGHEEGQAVGHGAVDADAPHQCGVDASRGQGSGHIVDHDAGGT